MNPIDQRKSGFFQRKSATQPERGSLPRRWRARLSALTEEGRPVAELARLVELAREDLEAHDGEWSRPGFQALLVHRFGTWRMSIRSRLLRAPSASAAAPVSYTHLTLPTKRIV